MTYTVVLNHWIDGSGWSHSEYFDHLNELCTAEEYIKILDFSLLPPPVGCDDTLVAIEDEDGNRLSEALASEVEGDCDA